MTTPHLLTVPQAAERLQIHPQAVYRLIWAGQLEWTNVGTGKRPRIRVSEKQLAAFLREREEVAA